MLIFSQIQSLGLAGDALAGIIAESPALTVQGHDAALGAQNLFIIQFCTVQTIAAAAINFFTKQHGITSFA